MDNSGHCFTEETVEWRT